MRLKQHEQNGSPISLVAMIDVLMIMLVFFMVTSTYLNLRMISMVRGTPDRPAQASATTSGTDGPGSTALLVRLAADGQVMLRGKGQTPEALTSVLADRQATDPDALVIILPSSVATTQSLVSLLDTITGAGIRRLRIVQLEAKP